MSDPNEVLFGDPISAEKLSGTLGPIKLYVLYRSPLNLGQPARQAELRAHVIEIIREENPKSMEGEIELAGVTHSFAYIVDCNSISLYVLVGSFNDIDAAITKAEISEFGLYIEWISPWLGMGLRQ